MRKIVVALLMALGTLLPLVAVTASPAAADIAAEHRYQVLSGSYCYDVQIRYLWPEHYSTLQVHTFTGDCSQYIRFEINSQSYDFVCYLRGGNPQLIHVLPKDVAQNFGTCGGYNQHEKHCTSQYIVPHSSGWWGYQNCRFAQDTGWYLFGPNALFGYHDPGPDPDWYLW